MSCKIIHSAEVETFRPLFSAVLRTGREQPWTPAEAPGPPQEDHSAEIAALQAQIVQLQASIPGQIEQARRAGFQDGETAGAERAKALIQPALEKLAKTIADIAGLRSRIREETEADLVTLSVAIAKRVLRRELTVDPDAIQGLVRAAMDKAGNRDVTRVRIYPGHEAPVRHCLAAAGMGDIEIVKDPAMQAGDVVFETRRGNLDISIDTQLAEIERGFADRIAG